MMDMLNKPPVQNVEAAAASPHSTDKCENPDKNCDDPAVYYCEKCEMSFCEPCGESIHQVAIMKKHKLTNVADVVPKCSVHKGLPLDFYSEEAQVLYIFLILY
jgi:ribosomal protein L37AE/L43A